MVALRQACGDDLGATNTNLSTGDPLEGICGRLWCFAVPWVVMSPELHV